jgi:hypothetical protein
LCQRIKHKEQKNNQKPKKKKKIIMEKLAKDSLSELFKRLTKRQTKNLK